jgi:NAD(P)-dependent dehydrogenase (short-subunit alcohol dehydrogenase family)
MSNNTYDLAGRFAIITGGAKGIGRSVAELFLLSGAKVVIWDSVRADLPGASAFVVDTTRSESVASALGALPPDQPIDILVNNAGVLGPLATFASHQGRDWQHLIDANLLGTLRVTHAVLPFMERQGFGRIVNLGSLAGKEGLPGLAAYSAASAGIIGFTKAVGREMASKNVLSNCVAPGPIDTDMIRGLGSDVVDRMIKDSPLGRLGEPREVAELIAWLCSDAGRFNAGAIFDLSGGRARY